MKRILHLANHHSSNIGNGALIYGLEAVLAADSPVYIDWIHEPWDDYTFGKYSFDQSFVDKVNQVDALIVGGAVTFNGREYNSHTGSRFDLPLDLWKGIRNPVIFYGLSYRHWPGQFYHHSDRLRQMIQLILDTPNFLLSVRNDGTKDWLGDITGIKSSQIYEVPDPALYIEPKTSTYPELDPTKYNIAIAFNGEDSSFRFALDTGRDNYLYLLKSLASAITRISDEMDINLIYVPHYLDDYKMIGDFIALLPPRIAHQLSTSTGILKAHHAPYFYGRYSQVDLAICMRVHAMSPCIGLSTPLLVLSSQSRISNFMNNLGLSRFLLDVFQDDLENSIYQNSRRILESPHEVKNILQDVNKSQRQKSMSFHQLIYSMLFL